MAGRDRATRSSRRAGDRSDPDDRGAAAPRPEGPRAPTQERTRTRDAGLPGSPDRDEPRARSTSSGSSTTRSRASRSARASRSSRTTRWRTGSSSASSQRHTAGCTCPPSFPVCVCSRRRVMALVTKKPIRPSLAELGENPRARSARLRVLERVAEESGPAHAATLEPWPTRSAAPSRTSTWSGSATAAARGSSSRSPSPRSRRCVVLFVAVWANVKTVELGYQIASLAKKREALLETKRRLEMDRAQAATLSRVEEISQADARPRAPDARPGRAREGRGARSGASACAAAGRASGGALSARPPSRSVPPGVGPPRLRRGLDPRSLRAARRPAGPAGRGVPASGRAPAGAYSSSSRRAGARSRTRTAGRSP